MKFDHLKAGDRIRIETEPFEGVVTSVTTDLMIMRDDKGFNRYFDSTRPEIINLLAEPRPDEPTGLGAVVEATFDSGTYRRERRDRWVRRPTAGDHVWILEDGAYAAPWEYLDDPKVLSEGVQ